MPRLFGWKKDKYDKRAYLHKIELVEIPDVYVLPNTPPIRDQGNLGACVGFAIAGNLTALAIESRVFLEYFSPSWVYNGARLIDGTLKEDTGAYPKDALDWIRLKGCLLEHYWPYDPINLDMRPPPSEFDSEALKRPIIQYYRIVGNALSLCAAIAEGHYVLIGTPWYNIWEHIGESGILPEVSGTAYSVGGHETCLFGYDKIKQCFYGINSWGPSWGNHGFYEMPFQAFNTFRYDGGYDAHYIVVNWVPIEPPGNLRIIVKDSNQEGGKSNGY